MNKAFPLERDCSELLLFGILAAISVRVRRGEFRSNFCARLPPSASMLNRRTRKLSRGDTRCNREIARKMARIRGLRSIEYTISILANDPTRKDEFFSYY